MPIIEQDDPTRDNPTFNTLRVLKAESASTPDMQTKPDMPSSAEIWSAAFRTENVVGSMIAAGDMNEQGYEEGFNPLTTENLKGYEDYLERFTFVNNSQHNEALKRQIDREREDRKTLAQSGAMGTVAQIAAGTLDPTIFIPVGGQIKKGESLLRIGGKLAYGGAAGAAVSEGFLQGTQVTRTAEESAIAIAGGAFLTGVAGTSIVAGWRKATGKPVFGYDADEFAAAGARIEQEMIYDPEGDPQFAFARAEDEVLATGGQGGLSADIVPEPTLDDYVMAKSFGAGETTAKLHLSPVITLTNAKSAAARDVANRLLENGTYLNRNLEGKASPVSVESSRMQYMGQLAEGEDTAKSAFKAHRKAGGKLTARDFYSEVGKALRRGDQHEVPEIQKAAQGYRKILDNLRDRAIEMRLLPKDVDIKTAPSYFHRLWNHEALMRKPNEFRKMTQAWANGEIQKILGRAADIRADLDRLNANPSPEDADFLKKADELADFLETEGDDYALSIADTVYKNLMGYDARSMPINLPITQRGPLAERTFGIPDLFEFEGVRVEDFLVNDAQEVMHRYVRVMGTDIELAREFGSPDMQDAINKVSDEYIKLAREAATEKEAAKINRERKSTIKDLEGMRDVVRDNYGPPTYDSMWRRGAAVVRAWNYVTMLGGVTVSALPDVANKVLGHGLYGITRDLLIPLATNTKGVKMSAREAQRLGIAVERILATRIAGMADIGDVYGRGSSFERAVGAMTTHFSKWTGMTLWNDVMKQADYMLATSKAVRIMERPGRAKKNDIAWLANLGIGEAEYARIMKQIRKHGETEGGMRLTNADRWDDAEAQRIWIGAMGKNSNIQTVTKTSGDVFLAMQGDIGKTIGQFKSFAIAANNRVFTRALQQVAMGDGKVASFFATSLSLGMLVYWLKMQASNRKPSDDPAVWVREGIDRSGMATVFMEAFNTAEKISERTFVGESPASRYASRGKFASMLGPSLGRMEDALNLGPRFLDGSVTDRDIHAIRKLLPYNNIFYTRWMLDRLEMGIVDAVDAEETSFSANRRN